MLVASQETTWLHLGTPAVAILPGVTSLSVSPAPLPGPGLDLAPHPSSAAHGVDWMYLLDHAKPKKGRAWGSSLPLAGLQLGVKSAGCFPGEELGCSWGPLQEPYCQWSHPRGSAPPLFLPGLGSSHTPDSLRPGCQIGCTCSTTLSPKTAEHGGPASQKQRFEWA